MEKKTYNIWATMKVALLSSTFKDLLKTAIVKVLKLQMLGGFRGWLIKLLVEKFSTEVIEISVDVIDYIEMKEAYGKTVTMEDRSEATDIINDLMR